MNKEKDYAYFSEALHSAYLFYTMEVDKLNKENKRLREALEFYAKGEHCKEAIEYDWGSFNESKEGIYYIEGYYPIENGTLAKQALGE